MNIKEIPEEKWVNTVLITLPTLVLLWNVIYNLNILIFGLGFIIWLVGMLGQLGIFDVADVLKNK